jgi:hypothetical protein
MSKLTQFSVCMFWSYQEWIKNPDKYLYLGSETNPFTKQRYDYWAVKTGDENSPEHWSATARHDIYDGGYGSAPMCVLWYNHIDAGIEPQKDFHYGNERARQLTLYYLATKKRPLADGTRGFFATMFLMESIGNKEEKEATHAYHFCSADCRDKSVKDIPDFLKDLDVVFGLDMTGLDQECCHNCGKPLLDH